MHPHDKREPGRDTGKLTRLRTGDEIVVSLPDPDRPGHMRRFKAKVIERLGKHSPSERGGQR